LSNQKKKNDKLIVQISKYRMSDSIKVLNLEEIHTKNFTDRKEGHNIGSKRRAKLNTCLALLDFAMVTGW